MSVPIPADPSLVETNYIKMEFGYPCIQCGILTFNHDMVTVHKEAHMTGFRCDKCPQVFMTKHIFELHKLSHQKIGPTTSVTEDYCQCKLCGGAFLNLCYLEMHLRESHSVEVMIDPNVVHSGTSTYDDKCSRTNDDLPKMKLFKCGSCGLKFVYGLNLDCHMAVHEDSKYACAKCPRQYLTLDGLDLHLKSNHEQQQNSNNANDDFMHIKNVEFPISFPSKSHIFVIGTSSGQTNISKIASVPNKSSSTGRGTSTSKSTASTSSLINQNLENFQNTEADDSKMKETVPNPEDGQMANKYLFRLNSLSHTGSSLQNTENQSDPSKKSKIIISIKDKPNTIICTPNVEKECKTIPYINPYLLTMMDTAKPMEQHHCHN